MDDVTITFVGGNLALDFAATLGRRRTERWETLTTADDLARWIVAAQVASSPPAITTADFDAAIDLRETVYRLAEAAAHGHHFDDADCRTLSAAADFALPSVTLRPDGTVRRVGPVHSALAEIARSAVDLFGGPQRTLVKECGADACTRLFVDTSRAGSRRWCDMTRCGNRAKGAAFRTRQR